MIAPRAELIAVLRQFNPWWDGNRVAELPRWRRAAFREVETWLTAPPAPRALLLSGARQVGKTTLLLQTVEDLLAKGVPPTSILYATFDHPLLKLVGLDGLLRLWKEYEPAERDVEYVLLDEIQYAKDWQTWIKHQVRFEPKRRIAVTGSATPLVVEGQESGPGRWHTVRLAPLSFYEYLQIKKLPTPKLPGVSSLRELFSWKPDQFTRVGALAADLVGPFQDYLIRGGFPQIARIESISVAQKLLREDIVDKVLKRDMTALYGVRRVLELEQLFLYLCLHDGGLLDLQELCRSLEVKKPTAMNFIDLLEHTNLIYRLRPFGYGKEVLRGKQKIYLADPAIAPSVLLRGKALLEDAAAVGLAVETAFFKHVYTRYYAQSIGFSYWRGGPRNQEVDIIADVNGRLVPFEVKHRPGVTPKMLAGLTAFCTERKVSEAYVITREPDDIGLMALPTTGVETKAVKVPAPLACYWLGRSEILATNLENDA